MTIEEMRRDISAVYPGVGWKRKCLEMLDNQVIAIYRNFSRRGLFDLPPKQKPTEQYHQMSLFELYGFNLTGKETNEHN